MNKKISVIAEPKELIRISLKSAQSRMEELRGKIEEVWIVRRRN
jgi:ribosomal protein L7/L12